MTLTKRQSVLSGLLEDVRIFIKNQGFTTKMTWERLTVKMLQKNRTIQYGHKLIAKPGYASIRALGDRSEEAFEALDATGSEVLLNVKGKPQK